MRFESIITLSIAAMLIASPALAGGVGGALKAAATANGDQSVGKFISGEIYGNTSNERPSGHGVLPSLAPGPWTCTSSSDCAAPTTAGSSMGDIIAPVVSDGNGSPDFANGGNGPGTGPDFSDN
jgi:hypothetical protein